ncbi:MAG: serine/threonine-protein kinase [Myxococcota bacterium]
MSTSGPETFRSEHHAYHVVRELGEGGQGKTLLVEREGEAGSRYVLKLLRMEHVDDWKQVELFEREVTTLAALEHPGIPRLVDRIVEDDRTAGIVQTEVSGHTIAQQITDHGPLSPAEFERVLRQCLEILAYLHEQVPPVLHRDINPRNVMLGERTYLIDFGAVRVGGKTDMTSVGTFGYMAPEQIIGRPEPASDMYGLGMTLVSLAERREVADLPMDASTGRVDASRLLRGMDERLRSVVLRMIAPGLAERLGKPREALFALDAPPPKPVTALQRNASQRRNPVALVAGLSASLLAFGVAVVFVLTARAPSPPVPAEAPVVAPAPAPLPVAPVVVEPPRPTPVTPPPSPRPVVAPKAEPIELTEDNSAMLTLVSNPPGVTATVDGATRCTTPCRTRVSFGEHQVVMEHDGKRVQRDVVVLEDTALKVTLSQE